MVRSITIKEWDDYYDLFDTRKGENFLERTAKDLNTKTTQEYNSRELKKAFSKVTNPPGEAPSSFLINQLKKEKISSKIFINKNKNTEKQNTIVEIINKNRWLFDALGLERQIEYSAISKLTNIPETTLRDIMNKEGNVTRRTARRLLTAFLKPLKAEVYQGSLLKNSPLVDFVKLINKHNVDFVLYNCLKVIKEERCPRCGGKLEVKFHRKNNNYFLGCQNFFKESNCSWTRNFK